jgi:hypothetical protein
VEDTSLWGQRKFLRGLKKTLKSLDNVGNPRLAFLDEGIEN